MTEGRISESHGCEFTRRVRYDRETNEPPSIATATALAQYYGEDVAETSMRLYDYIDPDALDALFADTHSGTTRAAGSVEFTVEDAAVTIRPGQIEIRPAE